MNEQAVPSISKGFMEPWDMLQFAIVDRPWQHLEKAKWRVLRPTRVPTAFTNNISHMVGGTQSPCCSMQRTKARGFQGHKVCAPQGFASCRFQTTLPQSIESLENRRKCNLQWLSPHFTETCDNDGPCVSGQQSHVNLTPRYLICNSDWSEARLHRVESKR